MSVITNQNMQGCGFNILFIIFGYIFVFPVTQFHVDMLWQNINKRNQYIYFLFFPSIANKSFNSIMLIL